MGHVHMAVGNFEKERGLYDTNCIEYQCQPTVVSCVLSSVGLGMLERLRQMSLNLQILLLVKNVVSP